MQQLITPADIVFAEMEHVKKNEDPSATVCPELSNHEVPHLLMNLHLC